jgi:hypothetical protein
MNKNSHYYHNVYTQITELNSRYIIITEYKLQLIQKVRIFLKYTIIFIIYIVLFLHLQVLKSSKFMERV